jgi:hypothetical protein
MLHAYPRSSVGSGRPPRPPRSTDGVTFTPPGHDYILNNAWQSFMGHRYAIFNDATRTLGATVTVPRFELTTP